jgi:hypothetical protein
MTDTLYVDRLRPETVAQLRSSVVITSLPLAARELIHNGM